MNIGEALREAWSTLTGGRKLMVIAAGVLIAAVMVSGWVDSAYSYIRVRQAERTASDALKRAAEIASQIQKLEKDLAAKEEKRDEKQLEVNAAAANTNRDRAGYDRAVREPRTDNPSSDQLCRELAALGYPCYR